MQSFPGIHTQTLLANLGEKIFGYEAQTIGGDVYATVRPYSAFNGEVGFKLPNWHLNIAEAFQVVDALAQKGYSFTLGKEMDEETWFAGFWMMGSRMEIAQESTAPLAICAGALKIFIDDYKPTSQRDTLIP